MNLIDVTRELSTEEECFSFLEKMRWPEGVRCAVCGNNRISRITRKTPSKNKRAQLYQCLEPTCKQQFSVTSGTIFHDSRIPLSKWFVAISLVMDAKKGMSAKQLQEHLGLGSYQTAWHMTHRIREAMKDGFPTKLSGVVEVDETYIGGKTRRRGKSRKSRAEQFDMVVGMRERQGRVRFFHVPNFKKDTIKNIVDRNIRTDVKQIVTDQAVVYDFALDETFNRKHRTVNHRMEWVTPEGHHTNTIESAFSLLKRGLIGSFHRVSIKHLHRYLSEFEYRFNERKSEDRFGGMVSRTAQTSPLPYRTLIQKPEPTEPF
jgi:transposase-like protein